MAATAQTLQHHTVKVGDFAHLSVNNSINVDYRSNPDSAGIAVFDVPAQLSNCVVFDNNGNGKLTITVDVPDGVFPVVIPTVTVYSRSLDKVVNMGDSTVRAFNVVTGRTLKARLEGNGRLSLRDINAHEVGASVFTGRGQLAVTGKCDKANLSCTGVGAIQADGLRAEKATVTINGTGSVGCYAAEELVIKGIGTGTVYYSGNPAKVKNRGIGVNAKSM